MQTGTIFNIQRYCLHDGPGIRTTVFLKGCPLKCIWCQNPEGLKQASELIVHRNRCLKCGTCRDVCLQEAINYDRRGLIVDREKCINCFECIPLCPSKALEKAGRTVRVNDLVYELLQDRIIFEESGGGVTVSGGEPLMQFHFLQALLRELKNETIHTTVDTCGYAEWPVFEKIAEYTDLFLYDLKLVDDYKSIKYTGVSNLLILENLKYLQRCGCTLRVRVPLVPSVNDSMEDLKTMGAFLEHCAIDVIELLPYHYFGIDKYECLNLSYQMNKSSSLHLQQLDKAGVILETYGIRIFDGENNSEPRAQQVN